MVHEVFAIVEDACRDTMAFEIRDFLYTTLPRCAHVHGLIHGTPTRALIYRNKVGVSVKNVDVSVSVGVSVSLDHQGCLTLIVGDRGCALRG